jgi:hypothetical protein
MWLDAQTASSLVLSSGQVSQWTDQSGSGNHATQSTANNRPTLFLSSGDTQNTTAATINGRQALYFDGVNDELTFPASLIRNIGGFTLFCLVEYETLFTPSTGGLLYHQGNNQRQSVFIDFNTQWSVSARRIGTDGLFTFTTNTNLSPVLVNTPYLVRTSTDYQTGAMWLFENGTLKISATAGWGTGLSADEALSVRLIGRFSNNASLKGKMGAMLFYNRVLSDSEQATVQRYLASAWGISVA